MKATVLDTVTGKKTKLSKEYVCRFGSPTINSVDITIFNIKYFARCLNCDYCNDFCCWHGVDIDVQNVQRLYKHAADLIKYVGHDKDKWFEPNWIEDKDFPGGKNTRTTTINGRCIFLNRKKRGCLIHSFCIEKKIDYHILKPIISTLFPLTFDNAVLKPAREVHNRSLVCLCDTETLYRGMREEIEYYFGPEIVDELDEIENKYI